MKKKWYVVLVLALFIFQGAALVAADQPPKKVVKLMKKADKAFNDKEFDKALENYNKALALAPEHGPVYIGIARVQLEQKQMEAALANLEKGLQFDPGNAQAMQALPRILQQLARQAFGQRMMQKAAGYYNKIKDIKGIDTMDQQLYIEALSQLGGIMTMEKKFAEANGFFNKVLGLPGVDANAGMVMQMNYRVGLNFYNMQKFKDAIAAFEKIIAVPDAQIQNDKMYVTTHYLIGLNASQSREYVKSNEYLTKFLGFESKSDQLVPLSNFIMGTNHMTMLEKKVQAIREDKSVKNVKKAIEELTKKHGEIPVYLEKALELSGGLEPAYMHLGNYYYYAGDTPKAVEMYKTLVTKYPTSPDIATYQKFLEEIQKPAGKKKKK
jgi:tetratricopeptide (TPR) repeat protein